MVLSKQEVVDWSRNKVTQAFFTQLQKDKDRIANELVLGMYSGATSGETAQLVSREVGKAQAIQKILDFSIEDMLEEAVEDEQ